MNLLFVWYSKKTVWFSKWAHWAFLTKARVFYSSSTLYSMAYSMCKCSLFKLLIHYIINIIFNNSTINYNHRRIFCQKNIIFPWMKKFPLFFIFSSSNFDFFGKKMKICTVLGIDFQYLHFLRKMFKYALL